MYKRFYDILTGVGILLSLIVSEIEVHATPLPYSPTLTRVVVDKIPGDFVDYEVPSSEQIITFETPNHLYLELNAEVFAASPLIITPIQYSPPASPYEVLANLLYVANQGNFSDLLALYDVSSQGFINGQSQEINDAALAGLASIARFEVLMAMDCQGKIVVVANQIINGFPPIMIPWQTCLIDNQWFVKAGNLDVGFYNNLASAIRLSGTQISSNQYLKISPRILEPQPTGFAGIFSAETIGFTVSNTSEIQWEVDDVFAGISGTTANIELTAPGTHIIGARTTSVDSFIPSPVTVVGVEKVAGVTGIGFELVDPISVALGTVLTIRAVPTNNDEWPLEQPQWSGSGVPPNGVTEFTFTASSIGNHVFSASCGTSSANATITVTSEPQ